MNVDLSHKEIEFILKRFSYSHPEKELDEELLVYKLKRHSETRENFMRQYQQDFKKDTPLPPTPDVAEGIPIPDAAR